MLLLMFKKIFSKVGIFSSCRFVRISLLVFSERLSSCLICFVIVVDSFFCVCLFRGIIWSRYLSDGASMVLNNEVICMGKSFLNLISLQN